MNTLSDSTRVSHDLGPLRFSLKYFNKAIMNFKGSFFVCLHGVEKLISFDHGIEGSITEDSYFVIKASNYGFSFDWIDGEMLEQSPFTFIDYLRQRRRWHQGTCLVAFSNRLKRDLTGTVYKLQFFNSLLATLGTLSYLFSLFFPISFHPADLYLECVLESCQWYFYWLGFTKNFNFNKYSSLTKIALFLAAPIIVRYMYICHSVSFIWALSTSKSDFQIVKKYINND